MRRFLTLNALGLGFGALFLATLVAQAFAGWQSFNDQQVAVQVGTIGLGDYVTSTDYAVAVAGWAAYDEQRLQDLRDPISWAAYVGSADFWERTLQNWQSEFLAVGAMAVLSIYLRQRGSSQSKPVGAAHTATGIEG